MQFLSVLWVDKSLVHFWKTFYVTLLFIFHCNKSLKCKLLLSKTFFNLLFLLYNFTELEIVCHNLWICRKGNFVQISLIRESITQLACLIKNRDMFCIVLKFLLKKSNSSLLPHVFHHLAMLFPIRYAAGFISIAPNQIFLLLLFLTLLFKTRADAVSRAKSFKRNLIFIKMYEPGIRSASEMPHTVSPSETEQIFLN